VSHGISVVIILPLNFGFVQDYPEQVG
jgi:hypothetical protein